jgi:hypothetical protein
MTFIVDPQKSPAAAAMLRAGQPRECQLCSDFCSAPLTQKRLDALRRIQWTVKQGRQIPGYDVFRIERVNGMFVHQLVGQIDEHQINHKLGAILIYPTGRVFAAFRLKRR